MLRACLVLMVLISLFYASCSSGRQYSIDKPSPTGKYRIKIEVSPGNSALPFQRPDEQCKIQYFKGQQKIGGYETRCREDEYESSLAEGWQVVEWPADNVARIGRDRSDQPFGDELLVSNKTEDFLKQLGIGYGRFQDFEIFDLPPGETLTLSASPEFKPDGTSNYEVTYNGITQDGNTFAGVLEKKRRSSAADGPLRFEITIDSNSYRK